MPAPYLRTDTRCQCVLIVPALPSYPHGNPKVLDVDDMRMQNPRLYEPPSLNSRPSRSNSRIFAVRLRSTHSWPCFARLVGVLLEDARRLIRPHGDCVPPASIDVSNRSDFGFLCCLGDKNSPIRFLLLDGDPRNALRAPQKISTLSRGGLAAGRTACL